MAATTADAIRTSVVVNGKRIDFVEDLNEGVVRVKPHGRALTQVDKTALVGAYRKIEQKFDPAVEKALDEAKRDGHKRARQILKEGRHPRLDTANPLESQEDLLLRMLTYLSEAPVGLPLEDKAVPQPKPGEFKLEQPGAEQEARPAAADSGPTGVTASYDLPTSQKSPEQARAACDEDKTQAKEIGDMTLVSAACYNPYDDDYVHTCATVKRWSSHDDWKHCFSSDFWWSGPYSSYCSGRCGQTRGTSGVGWGFYTLDCLDHDRAVAHVGYTSPYTYDEFDWAADDVLWGPYFAWSCSR